MCAEIVDIHPHIVSTDMTRYPVTPLGGKRSDWSHARSVTLEQMIAAMDEAGVDKAAMVHSSTTYGFECDYAADAVAKYPDRLTGVFSVNVLEPDGPRKMREWYRKGMTGMRIFSWGSTMKTPWLAIDDPRVFPCYEVAAELGIAVATNVTIDVLSQLEVVLKKFPQVTFVLDHVGNADFREGAPFNSSQPLFKLAHFKNLFIKLSTRYFHEMKEGKATPDTVLKRLVGEFGANRIAWGSNYPAAKGTLREMFENARATMSCLSQEDRDWILGKTALQIYPALTRTKTMA